MVLNGIIIITQAVRAARDMVTGEVHKYAQDNPPIKGPWRSKKIYRERISKRTEIRLNIQRFITIIHG